jgi:glutamine amidotransferase
MGNLNSVKRKLNKIGVNAAITSDVKQLLNASKIILPGVGHFEKAMSNLKSSGLYDALNEAVLARKIPILGICLGLQLMAKHSEEGNVDGFGWFNANVVRFRVSDSLRYKVPHMGWNSIQEAKSSALIKNISENSQFYFVHSYHMVSHLDNEILAHTQYDYNFASALEKDNIFGVQFHPEKSHDVGELMLKNFISL